jgi:hypothetical protein
MFGLTAQTLFEGFESTTFPPTDWTIHSPDGGTGWERVEAGTSPIPGWTGGTVTVPYMGGVGIAFCTYTTGGATSNDQWLVTKQFTPASGDFFNFWDRKFGAYPDYLEVLLSTTDNQMASFTVNLANITYTAADSGFTYRSYDLSNYVGQPVYVALRNIVADNQAEGAALFVDNVLVGTPSGTINNENQVYVNVFPNPATDYVILNLSENMRKVSVINALGQVVIQTDVNSTETIINTSKLDKGIYFISIETADRVITRKINITK